jgi:hypothetical protein
MLGGLAAVIEFCSRTIRVREGTGSAIFLTRRTRITID